MACQDGFGWLVMQDKDAKVSVYDCLAIEASSKGERRCMLPANRDQLPGLQALAEKTRTGCRVTGGQWLGSGGNPPISRYEVSCVEGEGFIVDSPAPGSKADLSVTACKDAEAFGMKCSLPASPRKRG